jgi:hypothetical protein
MAALFEGGSSRRSQIRAKTMLAIIILVLRVDQIVFPPGQKQIPNLSGVTPKILRSRNKKWSMIFFGLIRSSGMINTIEKFLFMGKIANDNREEYPALVNLEYDKYDPRVLNCRLALENVSDEPSVLLSRKLHPRILGQLPTGESIQIEYIDYSIKTYLSTKQSYINLVVDTILFGSFGDIPFMSGKYDISITLLDAPSVHVYGSIELSPLGEIKEERKPDDGISMQSDIGDMLIGNYYDFEKIKYGIENAYLRIEKTKIIITNSIIDQSINTEKLIAQSEKETKDILLLLSFINRRFVHWYEIKADIIPEKNSIYQITKKKKVHQFKDVSEDPLFYQETLKNGLFSDLVQAYRKSPLKDTITKTIIFLVASYEKDTIDSKLQAVYSAIDAIANRISIKHKILYSCSQKGTKVKRPINERIYDIVDKIYKINCWDFGNPDKINLGLIIYDIFKRRNDMLHEARIELDQSYADLYRLRALCERMVLAELGFNDYNKYSGGAYWKLRSISEF